MVEPIIGQPAIRHVKKWGSPDWEPDATPAHQVYARSAAMSAGCCCAQIAKRGVELQCVSDSSFVRHDAGEFGLSRTKPNDRAFVKTECAPRHRSTCCAYSNFGRHRTATRDPTDSLWKSGCGSADADTPRACCEFGQRSGNSAESRFPGPSHKYAPSCRKYAPRYRKHAG